MPDEMNMIAVPEGQDLPLVLTDDGRLLIDGDFPLSIIVSGSFLDLVTRGRVRPGAVSAHGHVEQISRAPSFPSMVWDSVTFTAENGAATYEFLEQDSDDFRRDWWRGVRRDIVDNLTAVPDAD